MQFDLSNIGGPHDGAQVRYEGSDEAQIAVILIHGRGASADDILMLGREIAARSARRDALLVAPQASGSVWYPQRFIAPIEQNQPWLDSARAAIRRLIDTLVENDIRSDRIVLAGFSQGACLASDVAIQDPRRYGGVFALSGGLIGPPGTVFAPEGDLDGTPVLVGCSDIDPHIPLERVRETSDAFRRIGAAVDERIYPSMAHTVNDDEIEAMSAIVRAID